MYSWLSNSGAHSPSTGLLEQQAWSISMSCLSYMVGNTVTRAMTIAYTDFNRSCWSWLRWAATLNLQLSMLWKLFSTAHLTWYDARDGNYRPCWPVSAGTQFSEIPNMSSTSSNMSIAWSGVYRDIVGECLQKSTFTSQSMVDVPYKIIEPTGSASVARRYTTRGCLTGREEQDVWQKCGIVEIKTIDSRRDGRHQLQWIFTIETPYRAYIHVRSMWP